VFLMQVHIMLPLKTKMSNNILLNPSEAAFLLAVLVTDIHSSVSEVPEKSDIEMDDFVSDFTPIDLTSILNSID
jgi:hypothetical protein